MDHYVMFVRFRETRRRLQVSLVETRRIDGSVRNEHLAGLGSLEMPPSIADRIAFWNRLHQRLANLSNRLTVEDSTKVLGAVHSKVPMPTADDQRALQLENAESDARFWFGLRDMQMSKAAEHKVFAADA